MRPAASVIFFSSLSGAGFGILYYINLLLGDVWGGAAFWLYFLGYGLAVGGLMLSALHLANKKNAVKAFREWRTSWLSREAVLAVAALFLTAPVAIARIFFDMDLNFLGWLAALLCVAVVCSTAMIYAQLKTVPSWNSWLTVLLFLGYAMVAAAILFLPFMAAIVILLLQLVVQILHFANGARAFEKRGLNAEMATGLGGLGKVRLFEPPHQGENYLLHEMGYVIARKHAQKLRVIGLILAFALPVLLLLIGQGGAIWWRLLILAVHISGVVVTRWLFFAEARHVMALYYGR